MRNQKLQKLLMAAITVCSLFLFIGQVEAKFFNTFLLRIGGDSLQPGDEVEMAKRDIIFLNKFHFDNIGVNTWGAIKAINPDSEIYLYSSTNNVNITHDNFDKIYLNDLGRYNVSRDHSMGSLNGDNAEFFLLDADGNRVTKNTNSDSYLLDFGDSNFQGYSIEATVADHASQDWTANGVFSDHAWCINPGDNSAVPVKYDTTTKWSIAMNAMAIAMTTGLHSADQKFAANRGLSREEDGYNAWLALDALPNPPDVVMDEVAFATKAGTGDIQFFPENIWRRQVDIFSLIKNSNVLLASSTDLQPGESGIDNWLQSFTFWDGLWFALGSYLIGKNDIDNSSYIAFSYGDYNQINEYYDEYDKIDLGKAIASYEFTDIDGNNIYWREFEYGYVFINPTPNDVVSIPLPETCKQRTHENLNEDLGTLPDINEISLKSHRAAILVKAELAECQCDLNNDGRCNGLDWLMFYPDWGRTDCNEPDTEPCECDLNEDGRCNGLDWLAFYPDWGRTDCP